VYHEGEGHWAKFSQKSEKARHLWVAQSSLIVAVYACVYVMNKHCGQKPGLPELPFENHFILKHRAPHLDVANVVLHFDAVCGSVGVKPRLTVKSNSFIWLFLAKYKSWCRPDTGP
jgi:hypothetical protein